jgi:DNA-binding XRE family transcriptional regulator
MQHPSSLKVKVEPEQQEQTDDKPFIRRAMPSADFVKRARARLNLTQAELANALGLERRSILRFEKGDELPPQTLFAIKHLLAVHDQYKQRSKTRRAKHKAE